MGKPGTWNEGAFPSAVKLAPRGCVAIAHWPIEEGGRPYMQSLFLDARARKLTFIAGPMGWGHWGHDCTYSERSWDAFRVDPSGVPPGVTVLLRERFGL